MLQKNAIPEVLPNSPGFYSNVFLVRKASGRWRPVIYLKVCPHLCTSFLYVRYKLSAEYCAKKRLRVQNRGAGCVLSCTDSSNSRKYLRFAFENKVIQFRVLPFGLSTAPQIFTRLGHTVTGYLHCLGILVIPYVDDWLVHHPDRHVLLRHQAQLLEKLDLVGFILNRKNSELESVQDIQFL